MMLFPYSKLSFSMALLLALAFSVLSSSLQAESDMRDPAKMVEESAQEILKELSERREEMKEDPTAAYEIVEQLLLPVFDVPYATRMVLGRHGRDASPEQRRAFGEAFYRFLVRSYADGIVEFNPENLQIEVRPLRGEPDPDRTRVRTEIVRSSGDNIPVDYTLRHTDDGWKVYDVTIEGVSYITNYRNSFDSEIRQRGLDAVIERLQKRSERKAEELEESVEDESDDD